MHSTASAKQPSTRQTWERLYAAYCAARRSGQGVEEARAALETFDVANGWPVTFPARGAR